MQQPIVLHHYPLSLFAEKIRRLLAFKQIPWRSVEQPMMVPKADLTALTGGYRRVPVLQIGADVYCDTALIARRLEELFPAPACFTREGGGAELVLQEWADRRLAFQVVPPVVVRLLPSLPAGILTDRAAMSPAFSEASLTSTAPHALAEARQSLDLLERALRHQSFLLGDSFSLADAACYHPLWFLGRTADLFAEVDRRPALAAWFARIEGFGRGQAEAMSPADAIAIARRAEPADLEPCPLPAPDDWQLGDEVTVTAADYAAEPSIGTLARITSDTVTIVRTDADLGRLAVHFPRAGYVIAR